MRTALDHIVVGASSLEQGVHYLKEHLGVDVPKGGEHPLMGTHNHLMRLGHGVFLELIAVNSAAPAPARPRWYGLDDPFVRARLAQEPQLLAWVVNTPKLEPHRTSFSFGEPTEVSRGDLRWLFGMPDDGRLLAGGMAPYLIQWLTQTHPADAVADLGCALKRLELYHPQPEWLTNVLSSVDAAHLADVRALGSGDAPFLVAHIETTSGVKTLSSRVMRTG